MKRFLMLGLACLLVSAAPVGVKTGTFRDWQSHNKVPLTFVSDGVKVHVEALPCPAEPVGDSTCRWEGFNNQAAVTVSAPGMTPLTVRTDLQSSYARLAVVRFDRGDRHAGVIVESQWGGSGGTLTVQLLVPRGRGWRALPLVRADGGDLQGALADGPDDLSGDGRIDLKLRDGAFDSVFGCNACTPRPLMIFAVKNNVVIDESRDPALRQAFVGDMAPLATTCFSAAPDRNGACAAYVADAARAGRFKAAWAAMLKHYEHGVDVWRACSPPATGSQGRYSSQEHGGCFRDFPESLRSFLKRAGYLPGGPRRSTG